MPNEQSDRQTTLLNRIRTLIRENGPISIADYMTICLSDRHHGYYVKQDPFGVSGDFITAPEVSQMFGELIGSWLRALWRRENGAAALKLVEFGPGRGTLMADMLRVIRRDPDLAAVTEVHLVETSAHLRSIQAETLLHSGFEPCWHDRFDNVPEGVCYVIANEFFDAIPFRQFVRDGNDWAERVVGCGIAGELVFGLKPAQLDLADHGLDLPAPQAGQIVEVSPLRQAIAAEIAQRLSEQGGAGLIIDYGHATPGYGDTFQAVRNHDRDDVLAHPGDADLTSHVDFATLGEPFRRQGLTCPPVKTQSDFLLDMGLLERAGQLGRDKDDNVREMIRDAVERLAAPEQMGHLFKVLCVTSLDEIPFPFAQDSSHFQ